MTIRRTGATALTLMIGGALATVFVLAASLRERLYTEHVAIATLALQSVGAALTRAHDHGVPLAHMVGLEDFVRSRVTADSGIVSLRLLDSRHQTLWGVGHSGAAAKVLEVPIGTDGRLQADFVPPDDAGLILRLAAMLLAVTAALALPLLELARLADLLREGFSSCYFSRQLRALHRGDLRVTWQPAGVGSDPRLQFLRDQIFFVNEQYQRAVRLVGSLRRTEPDAERRSRMSALLDALGKRFRFAADAGPIDRRVWPAGGVARCFGALTLLLANLSLGGGGNAPYAPTAAPYSALVALLAWSMGLLVGAAALPMHWRQRLRVGITGAALTNLLMTLGHEWSDVCAHALGGVACSLAACAALDGDRAHARRTTIALLLAGSVAGPVLGLASIAALGPFVNPRWLYAAAAMLAMVIAVWLSYRLTDSPSGSSPARRFTPPALATLLVGIAWSAAFMVFVAQSSVNREQALRLMVVQIPGFLLLGRGGYWARTAMAVALVLVGILRFGNLTLPGAMAGWPSPSFLTWAGAACMAGAFSASGNCRGMSSTRVVTGCAVGILITLSAVAVAGSLSPQAPGPVALCAMVLAVIVLLTLPAVMSIRAR